MFYGQSFRILLIPADQGPADLPDNWFGVAAGTCSWREGWPAKSRDSRGQRPRGHLRSMEQRVKMEGCHVRGKKSNRSLRMDIQSGHGPQLCSCSFLSSTPQDNDCPPGGDLTYFEKVPRAKRMTRYPQQQSIG